MRNLGPPSKNVEDRTAETPFENQIRGSFLPQGLTLSEKRTMEKNNWSVEDMMILRSLKHVIQSDVVRFPDNPDNGWWIK